MNAKSRLLIFFLMLAELIGCSEKPRTDSKVAAVRAYAKAEVAIEKMRKQQEPNWKAISNQYEITSAVVKRIDATCKTDYDHRIRESLEKCAAGEKVKVNQQILAKGLQHATVLAIREELNSMAKSTPVKRKLAAERIAAYFEGIRPTFVRRDKDFFGKKKALETAADLSLERLLRTGSGDLLTDRREFEDIIARTYALCVLFEIQEVERLRDTDLDKCDVKRMEAVIFYHIIQPRVAKCSQKTDEIISNILNSSYDTMAARLLEKHLQAGLGGISLR